MRVILLKKVPNVGEAAAVVSVADGFACNFLFPKKLAKPATEANLREIESMKVKILRQSERELKETGTLASRLDGYELILKAKTSPKGTLFAAITAKTIAGELGHKDFAVESKVIALAHPIKEPGTYEVSLKFPHGLEATIRVIVERL